MWIQTLKLRNFHGFIQREFSFHKKLTLIVGKNASGKTSLLEGLSVALGGWLCGFDGLESYDKRNITKKDCRTIVANVNNALLEQVPVEVHCEAVLLTGKRISWSRELNSLNGRTTTIGLRQVSAITKECSRKIHAGEDGDVILHLVAYYSAARL